MNKNKVNMDEIARLANVSKPTVSRALNNSPLVKDATKKHVLNIAKQHGYWVNRNAQKLRHKHTNTIAVSLDFRSHPENHVTDPFIFELLASVTEALGESNQDILLCGPHHDDDADFIEEIIQSRGADGFIFLGQGHREQLFDTLVARHIPFVVWGASDTNIHPHIVGSNNLRGGQLAANYFIAQNKQYWCFLGDTTHTEMAQRYQGLKQTAQAHDLDITVENINVNAFTFEASFEAVENYFEKQTIKPDAIFTWSDTAAMAVINYTMSLGLQIPQDISIVGYNDIPSARYFIPGITTIKQDTSSGGHLLTKALLSMINQQKVNNQKISTDIIMRAT